MLTPIVSILIILATLTGAGGTVYASQSSLPGQALYEVKLASENARLEVAKTDQQEQRLNLEYSSRRVNELMTMLSRGETPPDSLLLRLQYQLDQSLELATGMDDDRIKPALERTRLALQNQLQTLQQAGSLEIAPGGETLRLQARELVRERLNWTETGLQDPQAFRHAWQNRHSVGQPEETGEPGGSGNGQGNNATPGSGTGPGPYATGTPAQSGGFGPGPYATGTHEPGSGFGPEPGPAITDTPEPGCGQGPGPGAGSMATPTGNSEAGGGPGPGPGSGLDCTCTPQGPGPGPQNTPEPPGSANGNGNLGTQQAPAGSGGGGGGRP